MTAKGFEYNCLHEGVCKYKGDAACPYECGHFEDIKNLKTTYPYPKNKPELKTEATLR